MYTLIPKLNVIKVNIVYIYINYIIVCIRYRVLILMLKSLKDPVRFNQKLKKKYVYIHILRSKTSKNT